MSDSTPPGYPTLDDVLRLHRTVIREDDHSEPGVENEGDIVYALEHIEHGQFGQAPRTTHERAFQLLRLLVSNHPFVDGNKRTALQSAVFLCGMNGYVLRYGEDLESLVRLLALDERLVRPEPAVEYLETRASATEHTGGNDPPADVQSDDHPVPPELVAELRGTERLTWDDLGEVHDAHGVTFRDLLAVEALRPRLVEAFARADIEEHQAIYDRLAES